MFTIDTINQKIQEEKERWEKTQKELEQQFTLQQGAYLGRMKMLEDMLKELEDNDKNGVKIDDK